MSFSQNSKSTYFLESKCMFSRILTRDFKGALLMQNNQRRCERKMALVTSDILLALNNNTK